MIKDLANQALETQGLEMEVDDAVIEKISEMGYSPIFGARPLRKVLSENIRGVLAEKILKKEIGRGNKIKIVVNNDKFEIKVLE